MIVNLVGNAIKFTERGEIEVSVVATGVATELGLPVRFSVRDTGIGIPREKFDAIFESFSQADTSTTRRYGGTGLGLTISSQLIQLMGGSITVDSEVGKGSTFSFNLTLPLSLTVMDTPMAAPEVQSPMLSVAAHVESAKPAMGLRLLLAEDNAVNQKLATRLLEKMGHQVTLARDGQEALDTWAAGVFDAILMDVDMPVMNGYEATERIRQLERERGQGRVPVIALTAHALQGIREVCLSHGMDSYLPKPIDPALLKAELGSLSRASPSPVGAIEAVAQIDDHVVDGEASEPAQGIDFAQALASVQGDEPLLRELIDMFLSDAPKQLSHMAQAVAQSDCDTVARTAHTIKGVVGIFGHERCIQAAINLERSAKRGVLVPAEVQALETAMKQLQGAAQHYLRTGR